MFFLSSKLEVARVNIQNQISQVLNVYLYISVFNNNNVTTWGENLLPFKAVPQHLKL